MLVGVPKEIKVHEYRVGLTPSSVREMTMHNHEVLVQTDAGAGIGATDEDYRRAGAQIAASAEEVFKRAEMIVKVKEPAGDCDAEKLGEIRTARVKTMGGGKNKGYSELLEIYEELKRRRRRSIAGSAAR